MAITRKAAPKEVSSVRTFFKEDIYSLTELYEQQFENIITKWENALQDGHEEADADKAIQSPYTFDANGSESKHRSSNAEYHEQ